MPSLEKFIRGFLCSIVLIMLFGCRVAPPSAMQREDPRAKKPVTDGVTAGTHLVRLHGVDMFGKTVEVEMPTDERKMLLLVLSPSCPFCRINFHNWRELIGMFPPRDVVWVDVTGTASPEYLSRYGVSQSARFVLLAQEDGGLKQLSVTPTTILVGRHGVVQWAESGVLSSEQMARLRGLIGGPKLGTGRNPSSK